MKIGKSYFLTDVIVREYRSKKYLSMAKTWSEITAITDIGDVAMDGGNETNDGTTFELVNATMIGIQQFDAYNSYLSCKLN
jgi:hypothetical protein